MLSARYFRVNAVVPCCNAYMPWLDTLRILGVWISVGGILERRLDRLIRVTLANGQQPYRNQSRILSISSGASAFMICVGTISSPRSWGKAMLYRVHFPAKSGNQIILLQAVQSSTQQAVGVMSATIVSVISCLDLKWLSFHLRTFNASIRLLPLFASLFLSTCSYTANRYYHLAPRFIQSHRRRLSEVP